MASHGIPRTSRPEVRTEDSRKKELQAIGKYKKLLKLVNERISDKEYTPQTLSLTTRLLNENPEYYTIWNKRRLIISHLIKENEPAQDPKAVNENERTQLQSPSDILENDLDFLVTLLLKFPKCYWLWNHRLWIIQQTRSCLGTEKALLAWENELKLINRMLGRDNRNFHGWNYRRLVTKNLDKLAKEQQNILEDLPMKDQYRRKLVEQEFLYTTKMINTNLSNFSAWHQRSRLIPVLLNEIQATQLVRAQMLDDEFELIESALYTDPYDQSLWFYYQFLMTTVTAKHVNDAFSILSLAFEDRLKYLERELSKLHDLLKGAEDCKWIYQALIQYSSAYQTLAGESKADTSSNIGKWLSQLKILDPLRSGRWDDLSRSLDSKSNYEA